MVAINAMVATTQYADSVRTALKAGVDAVVCGAGLPRDLPAIAAEVPESDAALAPVVSGGPVSYTHLLIYHAMLGGDLGGGPAGLTAAQPSSLQHYGVHSPPSQLFGSQDTCHPAPDYYRLDLDISRQGRPLFSPDGLLPNGRHHATPLFLFLTLV